MHPIKYNCQLSNSFSSFIIVIFCNVSIIFHTSHAINKKFEDKNASYRLVYVKVLNSKSKRNFNFKDIGKYDKLSRHILLCNNKSY